MAKRPKKDPEKNTNLLRRYRRQYRNAERDKATARAFLHTVQSKIDAFLAQVAALEKKWPEMEIAHDQASARMVTAEHNIKCVDAKARAEEQLSKLKQEVRQLERAEREKA